MNNILTIGEGMLELRSQQDGSITSSFAGDTLNAAVYAKRFAQSLDVYWFSAIGSEVFSQNLSKLLVKEDINASWLFETSEALLGIYNIQTDQSGERTFHYWRKGSAATLMMKLLNSSKVIENSPKFDFVLFSGLSLAILKDDDKIHLLALLQTLKKSGSKIVFDPNYRAGMWNNKESAVKWFNKAFSISEIILPGLDEMEELYATVTYDTVNDLLTSYDCKEIVIKCGTGGVVAFIDNHQECQIPFEAAPTQVDSTAAGDSFAGTYLAARATGFSVKNAIKAADNVARCVVQHTGAIIDKHLYAQIPSS